MKKELDKNGGSMLFLKLKTIKTNYSNNKVNSLGYTYNPKDKTSYKERVLSFKTTNKPISKGSKVNQVHGTAIRLASKLNAPQYTGFFLKCSWHLSEDQIERILERSLKQHGQERLYYFIGAARAEMSAR